MTSTLTLILAITFIGLIPEIRGDYLDDYFTKVRDAFSEQLITMGMSTLKIEDATFDVNRTVSGMELLGTMTYTNFLVVDFASVELQWDGHRGQPEDDGVHLTYHFDLLNVTVFADVAVDLTPLGSAIGTAELFFNETVFAIQLDKNYTEGTTDISTRSFMTTGPATNFLPVSDVMDAGGLVARYELGYRLMWDKLQIWCDETFTPMITEIIDRIEFPLFPPDF